MLEPLFYQFFVLQGMGLLHTMPAYYVLKWISPASLSAGGFGHKVDSPLAMLPSGYGAMVEALAADVALDVRFAWRVTSIERAAAAVGGRSGGGHATLHFAEPLRQPRQACDLVALSGAIPEYVVGSLDGTRAPILAATALSERQLFGAMRPMQFLISLLEFTDIPKCAPVRFGVWVRAGVGLGLLTRVGVSGPPEVCTGMMHWRRECAGTHPSSTRAPTLPRPLVALSCLTLVANRPYPFPIRYRTLEYWPDHFEVPSGVIVRRDVGYGESGSSNASHAIGGLQSFSYWPVPTANKQTHWAAQQQWASDHGLAIKRVLAHNYIDTYLFHHNVSEVVGPSRKPWRLSSMQLKDGICNCTLYVGGAASFETGGLAPSPNP